MFAGATAVSLVVALVGLMLGGDVGGLGQVVGLFVLALVYVVPGVTLLGPLGYVILWREKRRDLAAYVTAGSLCGATGMIAMGALESMPFNLLVPVGAVAGAAGAAAFWYAWERPERAVRISETRT